MIKQYFKQALQMLRENPLVSSISIVGTALSIAMIMVIVLVFQISVAEYKPESHRNRMLYVLAINAKARDASNNNNSQLSAEVVKECIYTLGTPQSVTALSTDTRPVSLPSKRLFREYAIAYTDHGFWDVFDFTFLHGSPFTEADFLSAIPRAVITADAAARLWGTVDAVGQTMLLGDIAYTVCGVVKPVTKAAVTAYAEIWTPYSTNAALMSTSPCLGCGSLQVVMLAHGASDFGQIKAELDRQVARYNDAQNEVTYSFPAGALTRLEIVTGSNGWMKKPVGDYFLRTGFLLLFLLLVPALNLTGVIQSSVQKRRSEIGIRKAFGATRAMLVWQIVCENLLVTLIGGVAGLALSFALLPACRSFMLYDDTMMLTPDMLLKPGAFAAALLFVCILNLLSAGVPAMIISRQKIVNALRDGE
jgi:putative ABC transport system permease protein